MNEILLYKRRQHFPKPFGGDINVKFDLSNHATKVDLKNATGIDTSKLALKSDLANLKADLSKLSDVVKNDVIKISVYNKLVANVNNIDTSGYALKTKYDADREEYLGFREEKIQIQKRKFLVLMGLLKI